MEAQRNASNEEREVIDGCPITVAGAYDSNAAPG
jgi:hypothetical protein